MKPQSRPVVVEVKRKRGVQKPGHSIWGGVDLSAAAGELEVDAEGTPKGRPVDSGTGSFDVEGTQEPQVEQHMADPQEADVGQPAPQAPTNTETPAPKKRTPRVKKAKAEPKQKVARNAARPATKATEFPSAPVRGKRKVYSEQERAQKLAQIEKSVGRGASTKSAVGQAGISEQTYYQWKKTVASAPTGGELKDLVALEAENERLKKLLAERLRKENAELKKKLGLA